MEKSSYLAQEIINAFLAMSMGGNVPDSSVARVAEVLCRLERSYGVPTPEQYNLEVGGWTIVCEKGKTIGYSFAQKSGQPKAPR